MKPVAIVVPIHKPSLSSEEELSFRHLLRFLGTHPIFYAGPEGLNIAGLKFPIVEFEKKYFKSNKQYNQLLLSREFYEKFSGFKYILFYQLDALVFSDQLIKWCKKGYDYIAAPWPTGLGRLDQPKDTLGNGGFSLHNVQGFIRVLDIARRRRENIFGGLIKSLFNSQIKFGLKAWLRTVVKSWRESAPYRLASADNYFSLLEAVKSYPEFKLAPAAEAKLFAFEPDPRFYFLQNRGETALWLRRVG